MAERLYLTCSALYRKVSPMDSSWAEANLSTIRTLMERTAVYRRALAPICLAVGAVGLLAGIGARAMKIGSDTNFSKYWVVVAFAGAALSFLLVRRQAVQAGEEIFSLPARRVTQQLMVPFGCGLVVGLVAMTQTGSLFLPARLLACLWLLFYGAALSAAGFFTARGIRWFGWAFFLAGVIFIGRFAFSSLPLLAPNDQMMITFGGFHFLYGIYLYFTEKKQQ